MYVGHVAAALAGKSARPAIPLWFLIFSSQAPDWLVIVGRLLGHSVDRIEQFSETAYSYLLIGVPLALLYLALSRDVRSAVVVWCVCASHQLFDFFTGSKAFMPTGQLVGLGWYHRPLRDFVIESALVVVAAFWYHRRVPGAKQRPAVFVITFSALVLTQLMLDVYLASSVRNGWLAQELHTGRLLHQ
jgi:hypothetical protein